MKSTLKTISLILAIIAVITFPSCNKAKDYKNDVKVEDLADAAKSTIPVDGDYFAAEEDYIEFNFKDMPRPDSYVILMAKNTSSNINEVGIFKVNGYGEKGKEVFKAVEKYIKDKSENSRNFVESYAPAECKKLDDAECKVFGDYVVYTVLTKQDANKVFDAIEKLLVK